MPWEENWCQWRIYESFVRLLRLRSTCAGYESEWVGGAFDGCQLIRVIKREKELHEDGKVGDEKPMRWGCDVARILSASVIQTNNKS